MEAREAWKLALERTLLEMNAFELAQTLYSLGMLGVSWRELRPALRRLLLRATDARVGQMSDHGVSTGAYGLGLLGCEWSILTPLIQQRIFQIFAKDGFASGPEIMSLSFATRAITLLKADLGSCEGDKLRSVLEKVAVMNSANQTAVVDILERPPKSDVRMIRDRDETPQNRPSPMR